MSLLDLAKLPLERQRRRRTGWVGVEIGPAAVRIAQVERVEHQFRLARSLVLKAEPHAPFDRRSIDRGEVGRRIREAMSVHGGFRGRAAACALSMSFCELRTLVSVRGSEEEQRELISLELADQGNVASEPREFDFWDAGAEDEQGMTQLHVLSMPRSLSDAVGANLLRAGLKCEVLDGVPFTSLRAVEMDPACGGENSDQLAALLHWDDAGATVVVYRDGEPLLTRFLRHCGVSRLLEPIGARLKLTRDEAEALLHNCGLEGPSQGSTAGGELRELVSRLAADGLNELIDELNDTYAFAKLQFGGRLPAKTWLMGPGACIGNISARLEARTGVPAGVWRLPGPAADPDQPPSVLATAAALSALAWET